MDSQTGFDFKESETQRINQLITNFSKSEPNTLKYSEALTLLLERCVFGNKFSLRQFHELFLKIYGKGPEQKVVQEEKAISKDQLFTMLKEIAKELFRSDAKYLQRLYNTFLSEKVDSEHGEVNHSRVIVMDGTNSKLFSESCIETLAAYEEELLNIFMAYLFENYWSIKRSHRILLSQREIFLQGKKWLYPSLIHFLKDSQTTPHLLNVEHIEEVLRLIVPNVNNKQHEFYSRHIISEGYHKEVENNESTAHLGDPGLYFCEFEFLIARIAHDSFPKDQESISVPKTMGNMIDRYFSYLCLRKNEELGTKALPSFNRKMVSLMKQFYRISDADKNKDDKSEETGDDQQTPYEKLAKKMNSEVINADQIGLDYADIFKNLEKQLPKMPPEPVVEQQCPPPYKKENAITIGQQPPPEPVEANDKVKAEKKKEGKKDEKPPRVFQWAKVPTTQLSGEDYLKQIQSKLNFEVRPLSQIERGTIKRECIPAIIGENLFPPEMPKSVEPHLKAAKVALVDRNILLTLENYNNAVSAWKKTNVDFDATAELFFEYTKGCVYLSVDRLEEALQLFFSCRKLAETSKIPFSNPDRSLPFYGLGEVFYEMQEYEMASRCFLKAREIRESVLGLEHVQTASVFNNLAACFFMLGRSHEALGYIEIAEVVLDTELGEHHERTMTARRNLKLISHGAYIHKPEYRTLWEVFEEDKFEKKKKKKKEKEGKKK